MSKQTEVVTEEDAQPPLGRLKKISGMSWVFVSVLLILMGALGYGYFQLAHVNLSLARMAISAKQQAGDAEAGVVALRQSVMALTQAQQHAEALSDRQASIMAEWESAEKGDLDKWYAARAQYLVKLANDQLQFMQDAALAARLLQAAEQTLQFLQGERAVSLRQSLSAAIATIKAMPMTDVSAIYLRLNELSQQIDSLPFPEMPLQAVTSNDVSVNASSATLSWWQRASQSVWQGLRQIVIVQRVQPQNRPLALPEEKRFLFQNLHAQLQSAMWAVLHRNQAVYQASLTQATQWIEKYFDQTAAVTKNLSQNLQTLQAIDLQPASPDLSSILQLFDTYFAGMTSAKPTS